MAHEVFEQREPATGGMRRPAGRPMTQSPTQPQARAHISIPAAHPMVMLLGAGDSLLRVIEAAFPAADIHVRGNDISATGDAADIALIQRLFDEMVLVLRTGQPMTEDAVERSIAMLKASDNGQADGTETPAEVLTQNILSSRGRTIRPPRRSTRSVTSTRSTSTRSSSASAPPVRARPTSPWPRRSRPSSPSRSAGSS